MDFSKFFIDRPIFAAVLSIVILVAGLISMPLLPISEYPEVVPPTVIVKATYPGANPKVIAETVASPLEQTINGVEGMLYQSSQSTTDGVMTLTITFALGTNPDQAQVLVQNRVAQAEPRLPEITRQLGVTTIKSSPDLTMVVHLFSPDQRYDMLYLRNYAVLNVKDQLAKIPGIASVQLFGSGDYAMRIWLNPQKIAERGMTADEVVAAIRRQNVQVAAGTVGGPPYDEGIDVQLPINAQGRLTDADQFSEIIIKRDNGVVTRLKDVARIEVDAAEYGLRSLLNNKPAVAIPIFQSPGSNAIEISNQVRATMADLKKFFPEGVEYSIVYDPTVFVRGSIDAVIHTLLAAVALVVLVVILFLQTWRASIIPLLSVPVSIVGTFAIMHLFGFSINALSLFGLVLAIGIVVDDAIVVVENVERNIEGGRTPLEAAHQAMTEVSGPIVAIALVLCAVFVPMAFLTGVTGTFYKQFAVTIAISTVISAINSLTLSPALAAKLLHSHDAPKDMLSRLIERLLGWFFRPFNRFFKASSDSYQGAVSRTLGRRGVVFMVYVVLLAGTGLMFNAVPRGFIPTQDKLYLIAGVKLPEGSSLERSDAVLQRMKDIALGTEGVAHVIGLTGFNPTQQTNTPNYAVAFPILKPFNERHRSAKEIAADIQAKIAKIKEGFAFVLNPPPVLGLGQGAGYSLFVEDRAGAGYGALQQAANALQTAAVIGRASCRERV